MNDNQRIFETFVKIKTILEQDENLAQYEKNARQIRLDNMAAKDPKSALPFLRLDQERTEIKPGFVGPPSSAMGQENLDKHLLKQAELRRERRAKGLKESNSDAERAKADARTLQRYGPGTEASEIKRMGLSDDQVAGLPEDQLQRAKALQKLSVQRAHSNAADTARNFGLNDETAELARSAANQRLKAEGQGRSWQTPEESEISGVGPDLLRKNIRSYLDSKNSQSAEAMNAARASDRARSARTGTPVGQGVEGVRSEAEVSARMAQYEKGARDSRMANIRSSDPQAANALERAQRADARMKDTAQQWGQIGSDIGKEMDDIEDSMAQRKIDSFKRDRQREKNTQAEIDAEEQRKTYDAVRGMQGAGKIEDKIFGYKTAIRNVGKPSNAPAARPSQQTSSTISNRQQSPTQEQQPRQSGPGVGLGRSEPFMDVRNQTRTSSSINRSPTVGQTGLGIMASKNSQTQSGIRPMA